MVDAARWGEISALFDELVELPPAEREQRLAAIADAVLAAEVRALLAADEQDGVLDAGVPDVVPGLLADAAPNACNLCHLDRPIEWTLAELRAGWDVSLAIRTTAYGDDNVGDVWLASKSPALRLMAMQAYARSRLGPFVRAQIEKGLTDPQAYVRAWTKLSLDELNAKK